MPLPQPPAELCDPMKGRSRVSTLSSSPRAKLCSAELDGGQLPDWRLAAAPSRSSSPVSLSLFLCLFFFFFFNSLPLTQYQSLSVPMQPFPLFCLPHFLLRPPTQCTTLQPLFPVLSSCMAAESWLAVDAKGQYEKPQCLL